MNTQQQQALSDVQTELDKEVAAGMIRPQDAVDIVHNIEKALADGTATPEAIEDTVESSKMLRSVIESFSAQGDTGNEDLASDEDAATDDFDDLLDGDDLDDEDQS